MKRFLQALLVVAVAPLAMALVLDHVPDLRELSRGADTVLVGTVVSQQSHWNGERSLILTETEFAVDTWVRGTPRPKFRVTEVGGTVGTTSLNNPGQAHYAVGGRYLVFGVARHTGGTRTFWGSLGRAEVVKGRVDARHLTAGAGDVELSYLVARVRLALGAQP